MASISVYSTPNSTVKLNGKIYGTTSSDGSFYFSELKPARYVVSISLNGYQGSSRTITLKAGSSELLQMPLDPFPGKLNITPNIDGTTIEVSGIGTYSNKVTSLSVAAGNYQITVSKAGYQRISQNEYIAPGETKNIKIPLERINIQNTLAEVQRLYASRDFQTAIGLCNDILAVEPNNARANLFIGISFVGLKDFDRSFDYLIRAVSGGERLRLVLGRRRAVLFDEGLEFGYIELTQTTLAFYNKKTGTEKLDFIIPYNKIAALKKENFNNKSSYIWRISMDILVPKKNTKEDKKDFDFYGSSARVENVTLSDGKTTVSKIKCSDCEAEIQFIYKLILNFRDKTAGIKPD